MQIINRYLILLNLLIFLTNSGFGSDEVKKNRMKSDLDFIRNSFDVYYAPKEWKEIYSGWSLEAQIKIAKDKIDQTSDITTKKYQQILNKFFQSTQDYHVGIYFHSTESASLPFIVHGTDGKYYIDRINYASLPSEASILKPGDEILTLDNKPVDQIIKEFISTDTNHSNPATDEAFATYYLTRREAAKGHLVPRGNVIVQVKPKGEAFIKKFNFKWNYLPERIANAFEGNSTTIEAENDIKSILKRLDRNMILPDYARLKVINSNEEQENELLGARKSFIPFLSENILWVSDDDCPIHAYAYETPNKYKIGYIRIPTFLCEDEEFEVFCSIISLFQQHSDGLIIDQVNNPGGSASYLIRLLSVLSNKPLVTPKQRIMITQEEVENALNSIDFLSMLIENPEYIKNLNFPYTLEQSKLLIKYFEFIVSEWTNGHSFTKNYPFMGFDKIPIDPARKQYTKPILVLVNGLDFSCADFFPAILQDNGRATIMGTRTAGAGGSIEEVKFPNRFGVDFFSYTTSIAERLNKQPIENLGVNPDIEYKLQEKDYQNNYNGYVKAINSVIVDLVKKK